MYVGIKTSVNKSLKVKKDLSKVSTWEWKCEWCISVDCAGVWNLHPLCNRIYGNMLQNIMQYITQYILETSAYTF